MWPRFILRKWLLRRRPRPRKYDTDSESETDDERRDRGCDVPGVSPAMAMHKRGQSETLWTEYTQPHEYRIFVGTWNVGGISPPEDVQLEDWLNTQEPSDIYVIGFQEIVPLKAGKVLGSEDSRVAEKWDSLIGKALNKTRGETATGRSRSAPPSWDLDRTTSDDTALSSLGLRLDRDLISLEGAAAQPVIHNIPVSNRRPRECYRRIVRKQMVGLFITIWVKSGLRRYIRNSKVSCVGCGIMGYLGNKGSISVSFSLHHTSFCFVCAHLASGQREGDEGRRNSDVAEILKRTNFPRDSTTSLSQTIMGHDQIIWFGDLNYRLALSENEARSLIEKKDWKTLQQSDELKMEQNVGRVFQGWEEGLIDFPPTYKYAMNSDHYSGTQNKAGEKRRVPAWCDRILWYGKGLTETTYERSDYRFSDHRPVSATFTTRMEVLCDRKVEKSLSLSIKLLEAENLLSPEIGKVQPEITDEITPAMKAEAMGDLIPILKELEIESLLSQKLNAWDREFERHAARLLPGNSTEN